MAGYGVLKETCNRCQHECDCDNLVCSPPMGVGMTDKSDPCGCGVCECEPNRSNPTRD